MLEGLNLVNICFGARSCPLRNNPFGKSASLLGFSQILHCYRILENKTKSKRTPSLAALVFVGKRIGLSERE